MKEVSRYRRVTPPLGTAARVARSAVWLRRSLHLRDFLLRRDFFCALAFFFAALFEPWELWKLTKASLRLF